MKVTLSGNTTTIGWSTLTETNTRSFEVERSTDGVNFKFVTQVSATGTSSVSRSYGIEDFLPAEGTYYYRVKSIDGDGRSSYSSVQRIDYYNSGDKIILGPNPFESGINISNMHQVKRLDIVDLSGRVVLSKMLNNQQSIRLEAPGLPGGVYNLRLVKIDGRAVYFKIVKM